jgi:hypothetical protein
MELRVVRPTRGSVWLSLLATLEIMTGAALAHLAAGGALPSAGWLAAAALAVFGAGVVVLQRRVGLLTGAVLAGLSQLGLHEVFAAFSAAPGAEHHHAVATSLGSADGAAMLLAHACAAVLSVVVWVLHRRAFAVAVRSLPIPRVAVAGRLLAESTQFVLRPALWAHVSPRRGPPRPAGL